MLRVKAVAIGNELIILPWIDNEVMQLTIGEHLARIGIVSVAVFDA